MATIPKLIAEERAYARGYEAGHRDGVATQRAAQRVIDNDEIKSAVHDAAIAWCGEKERETFLSDIEYFEHNWRSLPGLEAYVDRAFGRRARSALARLTEAKD